MKMKGSMLAVLALTVLAVGAKAETYDIDPTHSSVEFRVRHLIGKVQGKFMKFNGSFDYDAKNPKAWSAQAEIDPASIDTGVDKRDAHLRGADFFDVEKHPTMTFKSVKVSGKKGEPTKMTGDLTMHGVTLPVELDLTFNGVAKDPWGNTRAGFTARGTLSRKAFGLTWNKTLETGGVMVGDEIAITLEVEGIAKK